MTMKSISKLVLILVFGLLIGGTAFLATWDIPAPKNTIEKVLPDDRFPR